jgi:hypothetical protein
VTTSDGEVAKVCWTAIIQWPNKKEIRFGNLFMNADAKYHEVEDAMHARIAEYAPTGYSVVKLVRGALFFVPEEAK